NAFVSLTAEGARFGGMMDAQSKTLTGVWSTLKDNVTANMVEIGNAIVEGFDLKGVTLGISEFIEGARQPIVDMLKEWTAGFTSVGQSATSSSMMILNGAEFI